MIDNDGWNSVFWENHDNPRSISRYCDDSEKYRELSAKLLAMMHSTLSGTPYVYMGQELGMRNIPKSWGVEEYKVRILRPSEKLKSGLTDSRSGCRISELLQQSSQHVSRQQGEGSRSSSYIAAEGSRSLTRTSAVERRGTRRLFHDETMDACQRGLQGMQCRSSGSQRRCE